MSTEQLITEARARATGSRLGKSIMREMDADILMIRRLVDALEMAETRIAARAWGEGYVTGFLAGNNTELSEHEYQHPPNPYRMKRGQE